MTLTTTLRLVAAFLLFSVAGPVAGDDHDTTTSDSRIDEIVVTADMRGRTADDIPAALTLIDGERVDGRGERRSVMSVHAEAISTQRVDHDQDDVGARDRGTVRLAAAFPTARGQAREEQRSQRESARNPATRSTPGTKLDSEGRHVGTLTGIRARLVEPAEAYQSTPEGGTLARWRRSGTARPGPIWYTGRGATG